MTALTEKRSRIHWPTVTWFSTWIILLGVGLYGMSQVLLYGLQVTGLTDQVPWGLWITHDLSAIALGAGAFTFSAAVYLFRIERFERLARAAVLVGFLGYTSAMLALAMDIGRPDRFYHPLIYWNVHSVLWEITWCVVLYSAVLMMEVLPLIFEGAFFDRWPWLRRFGHFLHRLTPFLALLGMGLSLLHQSSLGATYAVLSGRAIWFKPSLPIMFIISAIAGGVALTLFLTVVTSWIVHQDLIRKDIKLEVARFIGYILVLYLYIKLWDWAATTYYSSEPGTASALARLRATTPYTTTFWGIEIFLGGIVPAIILLYRPLRRKDIFLAGGLGLIVVGLVMNRWNVTLSGLVAPPDWSPGVLGNVVSVTYTPSVVEIMVSIGIISYAMLGFSLAMKYLPIYSAVPKAPPKRVGAAAPAGD